MKGIGAFRENAKLVQLSFGVSLDEAKKEYVERGWWLDVDTGDIFQTLNLRPLKALKYVKGDDSRAARASRTSRRSRRENCS